MRVFLIGAPDKIGGASTEALHTIKLWRRYAVEVHVVPTWGISPEIRAEVEATGAFVHDVPALHIDKIPLIEGSPCVSFCNSEMFPIVPTLRKLGCPIVYANCMTWIGTKELDCLKANGVFDVYHFHTNYQRDLLEPRLAEYGYSPSQGHLIRGAFDTTGWELAPTPHAKGEDFVLGKLARSDCDKWSADLWRVYGMVLHKQRKALVMGVDTLAARKMGNLPRWAEWRKANSMPVQEYYGKIHCMLTINGGAAENWPRVGLEAMACGVPLVVEKRWGWLEMIDHGSNGFLGETDEEMAYYASMLAYDEPLRIRIAQNARARLESHLARPETIWAGWSRIFTELGA